MSSIDIGRLKEVIDGEVHTDDLHRIIYATDASVYREIPLGVAVPKNEKDLIEIVKFCNLNKISIIPRSGGTSLAGQCVGNGLVVDVSKYMNKILNIDQEAKTVTVQPGVIRDELNHVLKKYGLMFGPNTATANRATIGGMVGNNSCGSTSIAFGSTRDHIRTVKAVLSDGSTAFFEEIDTSKFKEKIQFQNLEGEIYRTIQTLHSDRDLHQEILEKYPKQSIKRRNTGYALDALLLSEDGLPNENINVCKLLCGSEGTLAIATEITIGLVNVPPKHELLIALQFDSVIDSLEAIPHIMIHNPFACELMDKTILDCTKGQRMYEKDRAFIKGDPEAVLLISFVGDVLKDVKEKVDQLVHHLKDEELNFQYSILDKNLDKVWNLRKAGLGLLANLPGDAKAVACIEDTAVAIEDLSTYISEFSAMMERYGQQSVYYAHAGAGEIHLRPILNLKDAGDRALFETISRESAALVKKYKGSLSGEHGDGRVRAPFIESMYGENLYQVFRSLKLTWDPSSLLNPGKIIDPKPITADLRYDEKHIEHAYTTQFDFNEVGGILKAAEKCNGSGDCRKLAFTGGTMCPSYMATRNEKDSTRARANALREVLTRPKTRVAWSAPELTEAMDLCLSCKGCSSECPSNVDMSTMKSEYLYQVQKEAGMSFRAKVFSNYSRLNGIGIRFRAITNFVLGNVFTSKLLKQVLGIHAKRSLPKLNQQKLASLYLSLRKEYNATAISKKVYLFIDEFSNYNDASVGEKALRLLFGLGYDVLVLENQESGRAAISKGDLDQARSCAEYNVDLYSEHISEEIPLIGIEPSAILTFVDEYPRLVGDERKERAKQLASNVFTIESFLYREIKNGRISNTSFTDNPLSIIYHGHCHQKALTDIDETVWLMSFPQNYSVEKLATGCCGMAGSFGYEKEHYELSMQIGELVLFPSINGTDQETIIAASGTSCRHQILDGTGRRSLHPVEVLCDALMK